MLPSIDRKLATIIGVAVLILGFVFMPMGKYKTMLDLRKEYPQASKKLIEAYNSYILQKENLEKIQVSLDRSIDINTLQNILPKSLRVAINNQKHEIYLKGSIAYNDVYKIIKLILTTSNLRFEKLHINNPIAIPITVFPVNMVNNVEFEATIKYLEVKR